MSNHTPGPMSKLIEGVVEWSATSIGTCKSIILDDQESLVCVSESDHVGKILAIPEMLSLLESVRDGYESDCTDHHLAIRLGLYSAVAGALLAKIKGGSI